MVEFEVYDVTVLGSFNQALANVEVAFAQSRDDALAKTRQRLANNPRLVGACVISIDETPKYRSPTAKATQDNVGARDSELWMQAEEQSDQFGPIDYRGFRWIGSIQCSINVQFRGEERPHVRQLVSPSHNQYLQCSSVH